MPEDPLKPERPPLEQRERDARLASGDVHDRVAAKSEALLGMPVAYERMREEERQQDVPTTEWVHYDKWPSSIAEMIDELHELSELHQLLSADALGPARGDEDLLAGESILLLGMRGLRKDIYLALIAMLEPGERDDGQD